MFTYVNKNPPKGLTLFFSFHFMTSTQHLSRGSHATFPCRC